MGESLGNICKKYGVGNNTYMKSALGETHWSTKTQCEITMPETYTLLTEEERYQIYEWVTEKQSRRQIAALLNRHHSTISKEINRNTG